MTGPELLTVRETADLLGCSEGRLRALVSKGTAPTSALVLGRRMFRRADVDRFIAAAFGDEPGTPDGWEAGQ